MNGLETSLGLRPWDSTLISVISDRKIDARFARSGFVRDDYETALSLREEIVYGNALQEIFFRAW